MTTNRHPWRVSLEVKVACVAILTVVLLAAALVYFYGRQMEETADVQLCRRGATIVIGLANECEYPLMVGNKSLLQQAVTKTLTQADVVSAVVFDAGGKVMATAGQVNADAKTKAGPELVTQYTRAVVEESPRSGGEEMYYLPVFLQPASVLTDWGENEWRSDLAHPVGKRLGLIELTVSHASTDAAVHQSQREAVLIAGSCALVVSLLCMFLVRHMTQPLRGLVQGTHELARGDLNARVAATTSDELGDLARAFNEMAESLKRSQVEILDYQHNLEQRVQDRTVELERAHKQLVLASRQAGMAEVATNVLHNVGNVLNSVNVSCSLAADRLRHSKVANLAKATALIEEHQDDLACFLVNDTKGSQLPGYLIALARHLTDEQAGLLKELQSLSSNLEHIKEIVAMQQSYAKVCGVVESLPATELVEDALRMNAASLARHGVQVFREYAKVPPVRVERHKVLQILVNLVRNAKYALDDRGAADKRLTLRVSANGDNRVHIAVIDNGVGIAQENLTRIFEHGFTTRKNGHGFGLHSGALAAKELGGALTAHSDGPGRGATFVLKVPLAAKAEEHHEPSPAT